MTSQTDRQADIQTNYLKNRREVLELTFHFIIIIQHFRFYLTHHNTNHYEQTKQNTPLKLQGGVHAFFPTLNPININCLASSSHSTA